MMIEEGSCVFSFIDEEEKRKRDVYVLKKDLEQFEQLSEFGDVRLVLCVWGASIAYSQSLVILRRMFEWCSIVGVLDEALCVVRNAERT